MLTDHLRLELQSVQKSRLMLRNKLEKLSSASSGLKKIKQKKNRRITLFPWLFILSKRGLIPLTSLLKFSLTSAQYSLLRKGLFVSKGATMERKRAFSLFPSFTAHLPLPLFFFPAGASAEKKAPGTESRIMRLSQKSSNGVKRLKYVLIIKV